MSLRARLIAAWETTYGPGSTTMTDERFDPQRFLHRFGHRGHHGALGIRYLDHGKDWVALAIDTDREGIAGGPGSIGPVATLLDMAGLLAVWTTRNEVLPVVTLDMRLHYLDGRRSTVASQSKARCQHATETHFYVEGFAHCGDPADPAIRFIATYMLAA